MIISIVLITAIITGGLVYFLLSSTKKSAENTGGTESQSPLPSALASPSGSAAAGPSLSSIDNTWNKYTNPTLGFSLKVLKNMIEPYGQCNYVNTSGDHSYRPRPTSVPVKIFETTDNVYIASEFFYKLTGETKENGKSFFSGCDKVTNTAVIVADRQNYFSPAWRIVIKNITNDAELTQFLKDRYGQGCSLGEKKPTSQSGVFNIVIKGDGKDLSETQCPINFATAVKYYPAKQKVAAWDLGQACTFTTDPNYQTCSDQEIADSFNFE